MFSTEVKLGVREFEVYYSQIYGEGRWPSLYEALKAPSTKMALTSGYELDPASLFPPHALNVAPGQRVLDMCAAPGGKSLVLSNLLSGTGQLTASEPSQARRHRLKSVLRQYLSDEYRTNLTVSGLPGEAWGRRSPESFDRILADVPCTGQRHLLEEASELKTWSASRVNRNAQRQLALLCSAWDALAPGGRIVYSTCSIDPKENDEVLAKLTLKRDGVCLIPAQEAMVRGSMPLSLETLPGEPTNNGWIILPDGNKCQGWGPIYWAVIEKPVSI